MSPGYHSSILQDRRKSALGALDLSNPSQRPGALPAMPRGAPGHNSTRRAADGRESVAGGLRSGMEQVKTKKKTDSAANKLWINNMEYD